MIKRLQTQMLVSITLCTVLPAGCNRIQRLPTAPTKGIVRIDSRPVPEAQVTFTPERGRSASAQTTSDGAFLLTTYETGDGAIVGAHRVTVTAREAGEMNTPGAPGIARPGKSLVPEHYGNTATSGLKYDVREVPDGEANEFEIVLTSR